MFCRLIKFKFHRESSFQVSLALPSVHSQTTLITKNASLDSLILFYSINTPRKTHFQFQFPSSTRQPPMIYKGKWNCQRSSPVYPEHEYGLFSAPTATIPTTTKMNKISYLGLRKGVLLLYILYYICLEKVEPNKWVTLLPISMWLVAACNQPTHL